MSAKLRQCRRGLTEALDQAMLDYPGAELCAPLISELELVLYVSCLNDHPEIFPNCCLQAHNHTCTQPSETSDSSSRRGQEKFTLSCPEHELLHHLSTVHEISSMQTLEELLAKLEFENELNRVYDGQNPNTSTLLMRRGSTGSADSGVKEGDDDREDEDSNLVDMVLEMEQDYELSVF